LQWIKVFSVLKNTKTKLKELNLPQYSFKISGKEGDEMILDPVRRRFVRLTPEEWVRQNFIQYLINEGKYPPGLLGIEVNFRINKLRRRVDILVHRRNGEPVMIIECKRPEIKLDEPVFDQIATYNFQYRLPYMIVTNGIVHFACKFDFQTMKHEYLMAIPLYEDL